MTETMVRVNGVDLCIETFGDSDTPAILLIAGASCSMDWWDADLCKSLAIGARFVIRYDHRDTGRSVSYPPGAPGYTGRDLSGDASGLVDVVAGGRAHLAGLSMGGGIAQDVAIRHPDQVATLTLMSTSPVGALGGQDELPGIADRLKPVFASPAPDPDWTDLDAVVDYLVEAERPYAGPDMFDEARVREAARRVVDRTVNLESSVKNHWVIDGGDDQEEPRPTPGGIAAPTLVIHGTEDPLFPPAHAVALRRATAGARLLMLDGVGHQAPPRSTWEVVVPAILQHTAT